MFFPKTELGKQIKISETIDFKGFSCFFRFSQKQHFLKTLCYLSLSLILLETLLLSSPLLNKYEKNSIFHIFSRFYEAHKIAILCGRKVLKVPILQGLLDSMSLFLDKKRDPEFSLKVSLFLILFFCCQTNTFYHDGDKC